QKCALCNIHHACAQYVKLAHQLPTLLRGLNCCTISACITSLPKLAFRSTGPVRPMRPIWPHKPTNKLIARMHLAGTDAHALAPVILRLSSGHLQSIYASSEERGGGVFSSLSAAIDEDAA